MWFIGTMCGKCTGLWRRRHKLDSMIIGGDALLRKAGVRNIRWLGLVGVFLAVLFCGGAGYSASSHFSQAVHVPAREYFATVQREMANAKSSITVCMYLFSVRPNQTGSMAYQLAETLKKAHDAGVRVEVILDQNINFFDGGEPGSDLSEGKNAFAYRLLRSYGIPVYYDDGATYTHSKVVVIDEETVIAGSTNWTDSAFNRNRETNMLARSKRVARDVLSTLRAIPHQDPLPNYDDASVEIPVGFIEEGDLLGRMTRENDARAFDTALFLYKTESLLDLRSSTFTLVYEDLAADLGLASMGRNDSRRQINKVLDKLQQRYGLIEVHTHFNQNAEIALVLPRKGRSVLVPLRYWTLGWNRRLSFAGKCLYLISQYESGVSTRRPVWSVARKTLARRYGVSVGFISQGITDLRRQNLLDVDYAALDIDASVPRRPSIYTPTLLYDPAVLEKKREDLKAQFGIEKFNRAQKAAALVYEDCDVNGIKELIDLENQFGAARVEAAVKLLGQKNPDNPKRSMGYLIGTIRNMK